MIFFEIKINSKITFYSANKKPLFTYKKIKTAINAVFT